jgi:hypothetical protein
LVAGNFRLVGISPERGGFTFEPALGLAEARVDVVTHRVGDDEPYQQEDGSSASEEVVDVGPVAVHLEESGPTVDKEV